MHGIIGSVRRTRKQDSSRIEGMRLDSSGSFNLDFGLSLSVLCEEVILSLSTSIPNKCSAEKFIHVF